jgi:hypothetical protein
MKALTEGGRFPPRAANRGENGSRKASLDAGKDEGLAPVRLTGSKPDELEQRAIFLPRGFAP